MAQIMPSYGTSFATLWRKFLPPYGASFATLWHMFCRLMLNF